MRRRASAELSPACREEALRRLRNPRRFNGQAIRPRQPPVRIDGRVFAFAGDTGAEAVVPVEGPEAASESSSLIRQSFGPCAEWPRRVCPAMSSWSEPAAGSSS